MNRFLFRPRRPPTRGKAPHLFAVLDTSPPSRWIGADLGVEIEVLLDPGDAVLQIANDIAFGGKEVLEAIAEDVDLAANADLEHGRGEVEPER